MSPWTNPSETLRAIRGLLTVWHACKKTMKKFEKCVGFLTSRSERANISKADEILKCRQIFPYMVVAYSNQPMVLVNHGDQKTGNYNKLSFPFP